MSSKHVAIALGAQEYEILRAIARGEGGATPASRLTSTQRLRFEMLGLIEDRADGVRLTARGKSMAATPERLPAITSEAAQATPRDRRGRRLGLRRRSPF
ncbi:hypothetical protein [Reyranella sp.]|uniref:hypothetical protein n=1 Tax=Reyranella sp. TaxID=1929291 RepID=UPI003BA9F11D